MSEEQAEKQKKSRTKKVLWVLAGVVLSLVLVCVALVLMGPVVGNVYSTINDSLS